MPWGLCLVYAAWLLGAELSGGALAVVGVEEFGKPGRIPGERQGFVFAVFMFRGGPSAPILGNAARRGEGTTSESVVQAGLLHFVGSGVSGRQFVFANFRAVVFWLFLGVGVERGGGQGFGGLLGGAAESGQVILDAEGDNHLILQVGAAFPLEHPQVFLHLFAGASGEELRGISIEHSDGGVNLAVQGGLMAHGAFEPFEALVFGQRRVLKQLGLPAVETAQTPGGGGDLFDIVAFEQGLGRKLGHPFGFELPVSFGVFAEGGEDDIAGKQSVRGGIAAGNRLAGISSGHFRNFLFLDFCPPLVLWPFRPLFVTVIITEMLVKELPLLGCYGQRLVPAQALIIKAQSVLGDMGPAIAGGRRTRPQAHVLPQSLVGEQERNLLA